MPTNKPRFMVTVSDETLRLVDEYRFKNQCRSQTQAINELINLGLAELDPQPTGGQKEKPVTMDGLDGADLEFMKVFDALSPQNQRLFLGIGALILQEQEMPPGSPGSSS